MEQFARFLMEQLGEELPVGAGLVDITKHAQRFYYLHNRFSVRNAEVCYSVSRFAMYKVGPVLSVSHGMGVPSISILLNELIRLLQHAGASRDVVFVRVGTSGGLGVPGGTVVVSDEALDGMLRPVHESVILGKRECRPAVLDAGLARELAAVGRDIGMPVEMGKTVCTDDFFEGPSNRTKNMLFIIVHGTFALFGGAAF